MLGTLLVAIGAAAVSFALSRRTAGRPTQSEHRAVRSHVAVAPAFPPPHAGRATGDHFGPTEHQRDLEQRLQLLEARVAAAAAERQRLQGQIDALALQLAARESGADEAATAHTTARSSSTAPETPARAPAIDYSKSDMERALTFAGLDATAAADIKRRGDELAMAEMHVRDQATREQWLDSPRFAAEMAAIEAQRTSVRDEVGDDAYDRYLYALGQPNRVRIDDVMAQSPAEEAGLQSGDMIVRYGDTRIFAPDELVGETRNGTLGENVRLSVIRNGERLEVEVPRGPLGLRVGATQDQPGPG